MSGRRRRQEADDFIRRFNGLQPEQARPIMAALISNALISSTVQIVLVATYARAARRAFEARHSNSRPPAYAVLTRPVVALTCALVLHLIGTQTLISRWTRYAVRRAEIRTQLF